MRESPVTQFRRSYLSVTKRTMSIFSDGSNSLKYLQMLVENVKCTKFCYKGSRKVDTINMITCESVALTDCNNSLCVSKAWLLIAHCRLQAGNWENVTLSKVQNQTPAWLHSGHYMLRRLPQRPPKRSMFATSSHQVLVLHNAFSTTQFVFSISTLNFS